MTQNCRFLAKPKQCCVTIYFFSSVPLCLVCPVVSLFLSVLFLSLVMCFCFAFWVVRFPVFPLRVFCCFRLLLFISQCSCWFPVLLFFVIRVLVCLSPCLLSCSLCFVFLLCSYCASVWYLCDHFSLSAFSGLCFANSCAVYRLFHFMFDVSSVCSCIPTLFVVCCCFTVPAFVVICLSCHMAFSLFVIDRWFC